MLKGVSNVEPGYAGGSSINPQYEQVGTGETGHVEVIRVTYNPTIVSFDDLLTVFFGSHDPTTPNRQGNDVGTQYRSVIFYSFEIEKRLAEEKIEELDASIHDGTHIVTEVRQLERFYPAEEYHHRYFEQHASAPYCQLVIEPKIEKLRQHFADLLK